MLVNNLFLKETSQNTWKEAAMEYLSSRGSRNTPSHFTLQIAETLLLMNLCSGVWNVMLHSPFCLLWAMLRDAQKMAAEETSADEALYKFCGRV